MKKVEKEKALIMRVQGYSMKDISKSLGVAKSSVSYWVRNIELTEDQKQYLLKKGLFREEIERRRKTRLSNEQLKRDTAINSAMNMVPSITKKQIWLMGIMLYWAEGAKTQRTVKFSNSDPRLIWIMMHFFREICNVPEQKFRGYVHIHQHLDYRLAENYWASVSGIPLTKFFKTYRKQNKSSLGKKDNLPYGTFDVYVLDTQLFYKIQGWTNGVALKLINIPMQTIGADERT